MHDDDLASTPSYWQRAWKLLSKAAATGEGGFSTPSISTVADPITARPRVVVLRDCNAQDGSLTFFTDSRSIKIDHLRRGSTLSWCFWDSDARLQLIGGGATTEADPLARRRVWRQLPKHARKAYATLHAPGSVLPAAGTDLPAEWESLELAETEYAFAHFAVLTTRLEWAEVLHLDRNGNTRLAATRTEGTRWTFAYLTP